MPPSLLEIQKVILEVALLQKMARIEAIDHMLKVEHAHQNEPYLTTQKILETAEMNALETRLTAVYKTLYPH